MKNVLKPLAKSVLVPLGLTTAVSAIDAAVRKKMFRSSVTTLTLIWLGVLWVGHKVCVCGGGGGGGWVNVPPLSKTC